MYYDFDWADVIGHNRATFLRGEDLAASVVGSCPSELTPALLLTTRTDAEERSHTTEEHYVVVVKINSYLRSAHIGASHATDYFARQVNDDIFAAPGRRLSTHSDAELATAINLGALRAWADANPDASAVLSSLVETDHSLVEPEALAAILRGLAALDADLVEAIAERVSTGDADAARRRVLEAITETPGGRRATSQVLTSRIEQRFEDVRQAAEQFARLLSQADFNETAAQNFIQSNPWLVGLDYAQIRPRQSIPRGELDFILERYDGFQDVLELKSPQDPIIEIRTSRAADPPTPSRYSLSREVGHAFAQAHAYRELLTSDASVMERSYGLRHTRNPRLLIVAGRYQQLGDMQKQILRQLNLSMRRVEIVPYDILATRAKRLVGDLERHLQAATVDEEREGDMPGDGP